MTVLSAGRFLSGSACTEAVKQVQSCLYCRKHRIPSSNTSTYYQARRRLRFEFLYALSERIVEQLEKKPHATDLWYGRNVKVVAGTGFSMPDCSGSNEPRAKKRRPGKYWLMNKPRADMRIICQEILLSRKHAFQTLTQCHSE